MACGAHGSASDGSVAGGAGRTESKRDRGEWVCVLWSTPHTAAQVASTELAPLRPFVSTGLTQSPFLLTFFASLSLIHI